MFAAYYLFIKRFIVKPIFFQIKPIFKLRKNLRNKLTYLIWVLLLAAAISFVVYDSWNEKSRLISGGGLFCLIFLGFIFSVSLRLKRLRLKINDLSFRNIQQKLFGTKSYGVSGYNSCLDCWFFVGQLAEKYSAVWETKSVGFCHSQMLGLNFYLVI